MREIMQHVAGVAYFPECTRSRDHDDGAGHIQMSRRASVGWYETAAVVWVVTTSPQLAIAVAAAAALAQHPNHRRFGRPLG